MTNLKGSRDYVPHAKDDISKIHWVGLDKHHGPRIPVRQFLSAFLYEINVYKSLKIDYKIF